MPCSNAVLIRLVDEIKLTLPLKIQWKQHHILNVYIFYKHNMIHKKVHARRGGMHVLIQEKFKTSTKAVEMCRVL
jgi:hypothetical protein